MAAWIFLALIHFKSGDFCHAASKPASSPTGTETIGLTTASNCPLLNQKIFLLRKGVYYYFIIYYFVGNNHLNYFFFLHF